MKAYAGLGAMLLGLSVPAAAQPSQADLPAAVCERYEGVVATGMPSEEATAALASVPRCGGVIWGRALARAVLRTRASRDIAELDRYWRASGWLLDAQITAASLDIAADAGSSHQARIYAMRALSIAARIDLAPSYSELVEAANGGNLSCAFGRRIGGIPYKGTPLPQSARRRTFAVVNAIADNPGEPEAIRKVAQCVADHVEVVSRS